MPSLATWSQSNKTDKSFISVAFNGTLGIAGSASGTGLWYNGVLPPIPPVVPCFSHNTKILCFNKETREEEYKAIETLRKGDLVKSYKYGYRKVDCIGKGTFTNGNVHPNFNMYK